jgi:F0F1-type ATP synthase membrane subunit b/b'
MGLAEANARASLAEQRLSDLKAMLDDMRAQRDKWQEQAQRLALPKPKTSLWRWLRSTG